MNIRTFTPKDTIEWNDFVDADPNGTLFHRTEWKQVIEQTFHYKSHYLLAENGGIVGVLPLFHTKSIVGGNALISTPFAVYGGLLTADAAAEQALLDAAKELTSQLNAEYTELRHQVARSNDDLQAQDQLYFSYIKPLADTPDNIMASLPREARRLVRKGRENGLVFEVGQDKIDEFHHLYAISVRKFGTPVFPKSLFENCIRIFQNSVDVLYIYKDTIMIAAVMTFYYKDVAIPYYAGSLPQAFGLRANNLMYLTLMQHALNRGCTKFDFGRSKRETGAGKFKEHMGFKPTRLPYQYYLPMNSSIPNNNPTNPKYQFALGIWKRLPLRVTKILGPRVVRMFP